MRHTCAASQSRDPPFVRDGPRISSAPFALRSVGERKHQRPGAIPAFFVSCHSTVIVREGGRSSTLRLLDFSSDAGDYWMPAFAGMTGGGVAAVLRHCERS